MKFKNSGEQSIGEIILFPNSDGRPAIQVRFDGQNAWLSQRLIADLFQVSVPTINEHLTHIYNDKEIQPETTIRKFRIVQTEGKRQVERLVDHYNLEAILAVGYRVRSNRGTQFRQWATAQLSELLTKGFVLDDLRLKEGSSLGQDYFDELLERIRDIRSSERRFYQKITDIYATSIDYNANAEMTQQFYATVQNKLHWAIHGQTAAELIKTRADASKPNMGLTTWKNSPKGPIRKSDVSIAKNYLSNDELSALNKIVTMYLDYAELQAQQQRLMHMADWVKKLDAFLEFNAQNILTHAGTVSQKLALDHAEQEFVKLEEQRRLEETPSDFDNLIDASKHLQKPKAPRKVASTTPKKRKPSKK
jgi:hypothetical protein